MTISALLKHLLHYLKPHWRMAILIGGGLLLEMAFNSLVPFSFKFIVDDGLVAQDRTLLVSIISGLAAGAVVVSLAGLGRDYLYAKVASAVLADIRYRMFAHLQRLSMDFYARARAGDILARFSGDIASVEAALTNALPWGVLPALDVLANTMLLFLLDWRLALVAMLVWPLCLFGPRVFAPRAVQASYLRKQDEGDAITAVQENIASQPIVKALNLQALSMQAFGGTNAKLSRSVLRVSFFSAMVERSAGIGIMLLQVTVLGVGAAMAAEGMISIGTLASFQALFMSLSYSLSYTTQYVPTLVQATGGMQRIEELLGEVPKGADVPGARPLPPLQREIVLSDVEFGYTEQSTNLRALSLRIAAGSSVAFVGASGSGKSTILNLLMRLYDPRHGKVSFDDHDIAFATQSSLREQMSVVFQESFLFNTSIAENIRMGKLDATPAEIEAAAKLAEIHDFIVTLPEAYATLVGERGGRLSGGQRQRVAIARAMVRNPRILLLDEATSALDPGTEAAINATLERVGKGRTMIAVTHRLASATACDCLYVLESGQLVEQGSHAELLARGGHYQALWAKQSGFSLSDEGDHATVTLDKLRSLPVLGELNDALLAEAAHLFVTEQYPEGRMVVYEGDRGDRFYLIVRGSVEVVKGPAGGVQSRLGVLEDGDSFGEIALLRNVPRTASVRTLTPCTFLTLQGEQFAYLLERAPQLRERLEQLHALRS